ncbi:MAG: MFS transporter [Sarcina sp.]
MNLLKNKIFIKILMTDIIQQGAIWIRNIAIMLFVMDATNGNPLAISGLNMMEFIPMFLLTFVGGIVADRYSPKKLMIIGDLFSFISFIALGFLIKDGYIVAIFIATFISAIVTQFSYPASQKYFKECVDEEEIETAVGISQMLAAVFSVGGPVLGSYFYFTFGMYKTIMILAVLFLISLCILWTLPKLEVEVIEDSSFINGTKLTFKYLKENPVLAVFTKLFFIISFAIGIANNLDIFLVTDRLGLSEKYYQIFSGIAGIGVIFGGIGYVALAKKLKDIRIVYLIMGIFSVTMFFEGYSEIVWVTMSLQFIDNFIGGILGGYVMSIIMKMTKQEYLGKVNGLTSTVMYLGIMIGTVLSGIIVKIFGIVLAFSIASGSFLVATCYIYRVYKKGILSGLDSQKGTELQCNEISNS